MRRALCVGLWTMLVVCASPFAVSHAQGVRVETKGLPDGGNGRIVRTMVPAFGEKLDLTLDLNIQFVPVQADLDRVEAQVQLAQQILCDATDGRVDLVRVRANLGRAAAEHSDIWWRRGLDQTSHAGNHVALNEANFDGPTLAHELGHYVLNLRDSYASRSGSDGCEMGPAFEPPLRTALANTIMETSGGLVCVDQMGRTHDRVDPIAFDQSVPCTTDVNCPADGRVVDTNGVMLNWTCELDPFGSELGTRVNQDPVMGDFSTRAPSDPTWTGECPNTGTPSTQLVMTGRFVNSVPMSTCGNGVLDPTEECQDDGRMNIACDETGHPGAADMTGTADCFLCRWDTTNCMATSCNGDGVLDPGEECDTTPGTYTCEGLGVGTGMPYCLPNCTLGTATCAHPALSFDLTSYETLRGSQIDNEDLWLLDDAARIGHRWKRGESEHRLRAYANRFNTDHWTLLFVMDGGEFAGGAAMDTPQEVARFDLEFDAMNLLTSINGEAVGVDGCSATAGCPSLILGSSAAAAPFGTLTNGAAGQTTPTGAWTPMEDGVVAGELVVELDLRNVTRESFQRTNGGNATEGFLRATLQDAAGLPPIGLCADDNWCRVAWNQATQRFESTEQTSTILTDMVNTGSSLTADVDMDGTSDLARTEERADWFRLARTWGVPEAMGVEAGTPAISTCGAAAAAVDFGDVEVPGQFVMVLDRSGSMEAQAPSSTETRLAMMQDAARNTVNLHSNKRSYDPGLTESNGSPCNDTSDGDGDGSDDPKDSDCQRATRVGLVTFNDQTCVDPSGGMVCVPLAEIGTGMMQTPPASYIDAIDRLQPFGWTGIGLAMRTAEAQLDMSSAQRKALLVLSDGENNRPEGILCKPPADLLVGEVNDPTCPFAVAEDLRRQGVLVITIPLGSSTDSFGMQEVADITGGEMLSAYRDDEVIPVFLHAYALSRAEKPVIARRDVLLIQSGGVGVFAINQNAAAGYAGVDEVTIPVPVEQGAQRLNLLLSVRSQPSATWAPTFELRDPSGALVLTETDSRVRISATSRSISVDDPAAGQWSMVVHPTFTVEQSHFAAQVENPLPGCSLQLSTHVADGTQTVVAKVEAYYDTALAHEDVSYGLVVRSIDGTVTEVTDFDTSDPDGPAIAVLDPTIIQYHGRYDILASCSVGDLTTSAVSAAVRRRGEVPGSAGVFEVQSDPIPAFMREDRATLSVVNGNWPPVTNCPNNDCDNDGILNPDESPEDLDGDGVPGPWDDNADRDEVTDGNDPDPNDPSVPGVPPHPGCSSDTEPPVIDAPDRTVSGCIGAVAVDPRVVVSDASCPNDALIDVTGRMLQRNGEAFDGDATFEPNVLALPAGEYVFEWTATDVNGNASAVSQTITVTADSSSSSTCCPEGAARFEGNGLPNLFILPRAGNKCVLGRGLWDAILTGAGTDYLSGGSSSDFIESRGANDVLAGGAGRDLLLLPVGASGTIFGESGDDAIELTGTGVILGGPGDDVMLGAFGDQAFVPGPGRDVVIAASGDDVVRIYDPCELESFELLDGGSGNDTLFTPVPVVELLARGVIVVGFENIIVSTADRHLSECQ